MYFWEAQRRRGARIEMVPSDDTIHVNTERLLDAIDEETLLVPISHVIFRSAFIQDVEAIVEKAHRVGAYVLLDSFQATGTIPFDVQKLNVDFCTGGVLKWLCGGPGTAYLPPRLVDVLLDAFAVWFIGQRDGSSGSHLARALELLLALDVSSDEADRWAWLTAGTAINLIGLELCDPESWYALTTAQVRFARETGALVHLQFALNYLASAQTAMGELAAAARLMEEDHLIAEATGNPPVALAEMMIATWRGREAEAPRLIDAVSPGLRRKRPGPDGRLLRLRALGALQRPGPVRCRARRRPAGVRAPPDRLRAPRAVRAG